MIFGITGKPGSGKSYTLTKIAKQQLENGADVFANFKIDERNFKLKKNKLRFFIVLNYVLRFWNLFKKDKFRLLPEYIQKGTLFYWSDLEQFQDITNAVLIMDEAQTYFNAKEWQKMRKQDIIKFQQHRKQGLDIYCGMQNLSRIDKEVRLLCAYIYDLHKFGNLFISKRYVPEEIESKRKESSDTSFYWLDKTITKSYNTMELINTNAWLDERQEQLKNFKKMSDFFKKSDGGADERSLGAPQIRTTAEPSI